MVTKEALEISMPSKLSSIPEPEDQILFNDAIACVRSAVPRAAYILLWIACAESLRRRFQKLSLHDGAAGIVVGKINSAEAQHRAADYLMIEEAKKYGFISDVEFIDLEHVYGRRCVFAHPYELAPSYADVAFAAEKVLKCVLSKPIRLRHGWLKEQIRLLTEELIFLDDYQPAVIAYVDSIFSRMAEDLRGWFVLNLAAAGESLASDPVKVVFLRRVIWVLWSFIEKLADEEITASDFQIAILKSPKIVTQALAHPSIFVRVNEAVRDSVVGYLIQFSTTHASWLSSLRDLKTDGKLSARQLLRFQQHLDTFTIKDLATFGLPLDVYVERLIQQVKTYHWYTQNAALEVLQNAGPTQIAALAPNTQIQLGNNVLQAADGSAHAADNLLNAVVTARPPWPPYFIEGLVREIFHNDGGEVRFKPSKLNAALKALQTLDLAEQRRIIDGITTEVANGKPCSDRMRLMPEAQDTIRRELDQLPDTLKAANEYPALIAALDALPLR